MGFVTSRERVGSLKEEAAQKEWMEQHMKIEEHEGAEAEVVLTDKEQDVATHAYYLQTQGNSRVASVEEALTHMHGAKPTKRFVEWLSDGEVTVTKGVVHRANEDPEQDEPAEADEAGQEAAAEAVAS